MTKLLPIALILLLSACGEDRDRSDSNDTTPVDPPTTVNPPTPPTYPPEGKRLSTKCDGTTVVREYADGKGGSYFEREENFEKCGYVPLSVEVKKREGDYFKPVIVEVKGTDEWDFDIEAGHAKRTETGLEITSDGQVGTWLLTIAGEQYEYELVTPPVCEAPRGSGPRPSKTKVDCEGYEVGLRAAPMIWYGEDDEQIVDIEISVVRSNGACDEADEDDCANGKPIKEDNYHYETVMTSIENLNAFNLRSGVWIRFVVKHVVWGNKWFDIYSFNPPLGLRAESDIIVGWGGAGGAGGQAFMPVSIYEGMPAPRPVSTTFGQSADQGGTMAHEVGHAMSLGHGVWGIPDWQGPEIDPLGWQGGGIFPWFGHGWQGKVGEGICGGHGTVMSYSSKIIWSNSKLRCSEFEYSNALDGPRVGYNPGAFGDMAGSRQHTDEAYALNRVRYQYSLIHNEHRNAQLAPLFDVQPPEKWPGEDDEGIYVERMQMCGVEDS